jgi:hypothetical protein
VQVPEGATPRTIALQLRGHICRSIKQGDEVCCVDMAVPGRGRLISEGGGSAHVFGTAQLTGPGGLAAARSTALHRSSTHSSTASTAVLAPSRPRERWRGKGLSGSSTTDQKATCRCCTLRTRIIPPGEPGGHLPALPCHGLPCCQGWSADHHLHRGTCRGRGSNQALVCGRKAASSSVAHRAERRRRHSVNARHACACVRVAGRQAGR